MFLRRGAMEIETIAFPSEAGPWRLMRATLDPPVPGVEALWGVESQTRAFREKVLPKRTVEWMVNLGTGTHSILDRNGVPRSRHANAWVSGLQRECLYIESLEPPRLITASLHPAYAAEFLGLEAARFTGTVRELAPAAIYDELRTAANWAAAFDRLARELRARRAGPMPSVVRAVDSILAAGGDVRIGALAGASGSSHKHLVARFTATVGLSPKRFARLVRLDRAVDHARQGFVNWTEVAQGCGYSDQAHFIREFKRFTGFTPSAFLASMDASGQAVIER